ncbi:MAG: hypothetical protein ABT940_14915, partial [Alphaproteobacteria bacterium]
TQTPTITSSNTSTPTPTITSSNTQTPTPTNTASNTPTPTNTQTSTSTQTPTNTSTPTQTPTNTETPTPTNTETPTNTPTTTPTPTPTIGLAVLTAIIVPGSVDVDYELSLSRVLDTNVDIQFTNILGKNVGNITIISGVTASSGTTTGSTNVFVTGENFDDLDRTSNFTFNSVSPAGLQIEPTSIFATPTTTPSNTPSPTPTVTPSTTLGATATQTPSPTE